MTDSTSFPAQYNSEVQGKWQLSGQGDDNKLSKDWRGTKTGEPCQLS